MRPVLAPPVAAVVLPEDYSLREPLLQALEEVDPFGGEGVRPGIVSEHGLGAVGPEKGYPAYLLCVKGQDAVVFQQDGAFVRYFLAQGDMFLASDDAGSRRGVRNDPVEESEPEFGPQDPPDSLVDKLFIDLAFFHLVRKGVICRHHVKVDTCFQRHGGGLLEVRCDEMVVGQPFDRSPVRIDISLEPHLTAEQVRQVIFRSGYRHPVVSVIRTHHAHRIRLIDHFLEGGQVEGPEFPFSSADPGAVDASRRGTMGDEMFKGASHAVFLVALHEGCRHVGDQ